ncbi:MULTISPECIES: NAD(P)-dependent oxidoreductase [Thalassospira]|uniref:NAD(P)-dependent oxidoreductase n=1 Tax=Thalassospira povalilytica TaxID=732237 RepID=A0ABX4R3V3_9PROT|nr:NAD(P)-dependent oxidoreductase [Thalassospira povalilytica]PKR47591.1 NAD(P)-dependent oxidoreductase [Thalassospira povalilytica]
MKVLVTGANGLIGSHTCRALLASGYDVLTCGRSGSQSSSHQVGDLLDPDFRSRIMRDERPDGLIHLAWQTKHGYFWNAPDNADWRVASIDLLDRFLEIGGTRAVLAGSCAEYDWTISEIGKKTCETDACVPGTLYGQEKLKLARHCQNLIDQGSSIAWGRLFLLCGPGEYPARFVPAVTKALLAGETAKMSSGKQVRDFMHVADAGTAFASVFESTFKGILNVASGEAHSLLSVANSVQQLVGRGQVSAGTLPDRPDDPPYLVADTSILHDTIGFESKYNLISALKSCIEWWRSHEA